MSHLQLLLSPGRASTEDMELPCVPQCVTEETCDLLLVHSFQMPYWFLGWLTAAKENLASPKNVQLCFAQPGASRVHRGSLFQGIP